MPVPVADFGKANAELFDDHHHAGSVKYSKKGSFGSGASYELNASTDVNGGKAVEWDLNIDAGMLNIKHDHTGAIEKEVSFNVKQVEGLNIKWTPSFAQSSGFNWGNVNLTHDHAKAHVSLDLGLPVPDSADFAVSVNPLAKCSGLNFGLMGNLSASGLADAKWGMHLNKGNVQLHHESKDLKNLMDGNCDVHVNLPNNKYFTSYGIQKSQTTLAIAAASGCCSDSTRFKLDHAGLFSIAKNQRINACMSMNVSAAINATKLSEGGHKFGLGFSFN